jgi:hypothetical protein
VGDDDIGGRNDIGRDPVVDPPSNEVLIRDAGDPDHIFGQRDAGILAPAPRSADLGDMSAGIIPEASHRQFDDPVAFRVEPGGLHIQNGRDTLGIVRIPEACFAYMKIDTAELPDVGLRRFSHVRSPRMPNDRRAIDR